MPDGERRTAPHKRRVSAAKKAATAALNTALPRRIAALSDEWHRIYRTCRLELEQAAAWTRLAAKQLERMVLLYYQADEALTAASTGKTGAEGDDDGMAAGLVRGSMGQPVAHPLWAIHAQLELRATQLAKTLKLTPDSRGTSAAAGDDVTGPGLDDGEVEEKDELAAVDDLARKRKEKARHAG